MNRMRYVLILSIVLAGCTSPTTAGNELGGVVEGGTPPATMPELFNRAEAHCAKYGKKARTSGTSSQTFAAFPTLSFNCI